jgi:hypothetical protein
MCARTIFESLLVVVRSIEWFANGCQSEDPNSTGIQRNRIFKRPDQDNLLSRQEKAIHNRQGNQREEKPANVDLSPHPKLLIRVLRLLHSACVHFSVTHRFSRNSNEPRRNSSPAVAVEFPASAVDADPISVKAAFGCFSRTASFQMCRCTGPVRSHLLWPCDFVYGHSKPQFRLLI